MGSLMHKKSFDRTLSVPMFPRIGFSQNLLLLLGAAVAMLLAFAADGRAFSYSPAAPLTLVSEYAAAVGSAAPRTQVWKVFPDTAGGVTTLRFFPEGATQGKAICVLTLPPPGASGEIVWTGLGKTGETRSRTGLLLVRGFPAPCDVLPVDIRESGKIYEEKSEAGGRVFSRTCRIAFEGVGVSEARTKGWLRGDLAGTSELMMVTATDDKDQPVSRQLWAAGGSWWLYEETPTRRSWLEK